MALNGSLFHKHSQPSDDYLWTSILFVYKPQHFRSSLRHHDPPICLFFNPELHYFIVTQSHKVLLQFLRVEASATLLTELIFIRQVILQIMPTARETNSYKLLFKREGTRLEVLAPSLGSQMSRASCRMFHLAGNDTYGLEDCRIYLPVIGKI